MLDNIIKGKTNKWNKSKSSHAFVITHNNATQDKAMNKTNVACCCIIDTIQLSRVSI